MTSFPHYKKSEPYLLGLAQEIFTEWANCANDIDDEILHPCYINLQAHIVVRRGLAKEHPAAYRALCSIADKYGVHVIEDRRNTIKKVKHDKRRKLFLTVGLFVGLATKQVAYADNSHVTNLLPVNLQQQISLHEHHESRAGINDANNTNVTTHLSAKRLGNGKIRIGTRSLKQSGTKKLDNNKILACFNRLNSEQSYCNKPQQQDVNKIETILNYHLAASGEKHSGVSNLIRQLAYYYAHYPELLSLFSDLNEYNWTLNIQKNTWQARAYIQNGGVNHVDVFFDPGTAAQMLAANDCQSNPACTVSPADALLHELLHAYLMLDEPEKYAEENSHALYPIQHEFEVIALENALYKSMSKTDKLPRPIRSKHQASLVAVNCPVCLAP